MYKIENVNIKPLTSNMNKILFGSHFYPYHITLWLSVSSYNLYYFIIKQIWQKQKNLQNYKN